MAVDPEFENAVTGWRALFKNTAGFHKTAGGFEAVYFNATGNHNTADGDPALVRNTTGNFNTSMTSPGSTSIIMSDGLPRSSNGNSHSQVCGRY
jgi:hypothetical protein